jgi:hypothetical protein
MFSGCEKKIAQTSFILLLPGLFPLRKQPALLKNLYRQYIDIFFGG